MLSELLHDAGSMLHSIHQLLLPLTFMPMKLAALPIVLLLSPTATITSPNIHLFYYVFLMERINCLCCCLGIHCYLFFMYFLFYFIFVRYCCITITQKRFHLFYCFAASYCVSSCALLDGVCLSRNKRITYLLTYLIKFMENAKNMAYTDIVSLTTGFGLRPWRRRRRRRLTSTRTLTGISEYCSTWDTINIQTTRQTNAWLSYWPKFSFYEDSDSNEQMQGIVWFHWPR